MNIVRESRLPVPAATAGRVCLPSAARGAQAATAIDYRFEGGGPVGTVIPSPAGLAAKRWRLFWHRMSDIPVSIRLVAHSSPRSPRPGI